MRPVAVSKIPPPRAKLIAAIREAIDRMRGAAEEVTWEVPLPPETEDAACQVMGLAPTPAEELAAELDRIREVRYQEMHGSPARLPYITLDVGPLNSPTPTSELPRSCSSSLGLAIGASAVICHPLLMLAVRLLPCPPPASFALHPKPPHARRDRCFVVNTTDTEASVGCLNSLQVVNELRVTHSMVAERVAEATGIMEEDLSEQER